MEDQTRRKMIVNFGAAAAALLAAPAAEAAPAVRRARPKARFRASRAVKMRLPNPCGPDSETTVVARPSNAGLVIDAVRAGRTGKAGWDAAGKKLVVHVKQTADGVEVVGFDGLLQQIDYKEGGKH